MRDACERFTVNGDEFQCTELTTTVFVLRNPLSHHRPEGGGSVVASQKKKEREIHAPCISDDRSFFFAKISDDKSFK